jgi:MFS family permease
VNGIISANTTSFERRFGFSSLEVSFISTAYDISAGLFVIPIGYYGRNGHKPRWLAATCLLMGVGSCVMFIPHFITGTYNFGENAGDIHVCSGRCPLLNGDRIKMRKVYGDLTRYITVFIVRTLKT